MRPILVPAKTTPSGFGILQEPSGELRALSPCCGMIIVYLRKDGRPRCVGCEADFYEFSMLAGVSLTNSQLLKPRIEDVILGWIRRLTGVVDAEMTVIYDD